MAEIRTARFPLEMKEAGGLKSRFPETRLSLLKIQGKSRDGIYLFRDFIQQLIGNRLVGLNHGQGLPGGVVGRGGDVVNVDSIGRQGGADEGDNTRTILVAQA